MGQIWHRGQPDPPLEWHPILPGLLVLSILVGARLLGLLQGLEWKMLDTLLRWRPAEATDERVLIVGINEEDIQRLGTYPVPDGVLADTLKALNTHQPRAIGIDIFRDHPVEPGHAALMETLATMPNVVAVENVGSNPPVAPPDYLPSEQVGFVDLPLDDDGFVRRILLGTHGADRGFRFAFSLRLAEIYLAQEGLTLTNGSRDPMAMQFGDTELRRVHPNTGGFVNADASGNQMLLNPRSGRIPFRIVSLQQVLTGDVNPAWIENAIVIIGVTAISAKDLINSASIASNNPGMVYGAEFHAHATSQIVSAVIDDRPLLQVWPDRVEYLWIILWGTVAIGLIRWIASPSRYLLILGLISFGLFSLSFLLLWQWGWWIPLVPTLLVFTLNGLVLPGFYLYDQTLRSRIAERQRVIEERQRVIEQTYNAIHNGPLQTLALLLRDAGQEITWAEALPKLHSMNQELRTIYENLLTSPLSPDDLASNVDQPVTATLIPLHEKLCEIYTATLQRDFPGFESISLKLVNFEPFKAVDLDPDVYLALCRFFEEALCNVGKHAINPTKLTISCGVDNSENLIQVIDNGEFSPGSDQSSTLKTKPGSKVGGRGTRQAEQIARRLGGIFQRNSTVSGTSCELRWPVSPS